MHNADLSFSSQAAAREAPQVLHDNSVMDEATGVVVATHAVPQARAREIIADAARRAGQSELTVARELVRRFLPDQDSRTSGGNS